MASPRESHLQTIDITAGNALLRNAFFFLTALVVVLMLWLPFGFNMTGQIEEWDLLSLFTRHGAFFVTDESSPLPSHRLRPLNILPFSLAYVLGPDSFTSMHILQMVSLILKGACVSAIGWWLTRSGRLGVFVGIIALLYPADTMQLSFRSLHINWSVSLALLATACQIYAYERKNGLGTYILLGIAAICIAVATLIYELALFYAPLPYLLLYARHGFVGTVRMTWDRRWLLAPWTASILLCLGNILYVLSYGSTYQSAVLSGQVTTAHVAFERLNQLFTTGVARTLFGAWIDAFSITRLEYSSYWYLGCAVAAMMALIAHEDFIKTGPTSAEPRPEQVATSVPRIALVGILIAVLGYLPFLSSPAHIAISQRTYLFAALGGALWVLALVIAIQRVSRLASTIACAALLVFAMGAQMYQFHHYENISNIQRDVLADIVESVPRVPEKSTIVVLDGAARINNAWMLRDNIGHALTYLYGYPIHLVEVCSQPGLLWQHPDDLRRLGQCVETPNSWKFTSAPPVSGPGYPKQEPSTKREILNSNVILVTVDAAGSATSRVSTPEHIRQLNVGDSPVALRYRQVLKRREWPLKIDQFTDAHARARYQWDFGRWWSLEVPPHGLGWRDPEWEVRGIERVSGAWKTVPSATLHFQLDPIDRQYEVRGAVVYLSPNSRKSDLKILLNGHAVDYRWASELEFEAKVDPAALVHGENTITFDSPVDSNYYGLSLFLDWVSLEPA